METSRFKYAIYIVLLIFFINLCVINYVLYTEKQTVDQLKKENTPSPTTREINIQCDTACINEIVKNATSSISLSSPLPTPKVVTQVKPLIASPITRQFFISFGRGETAGEDWSDIPGLQTTVDASSYGNLKQAVFEATLSLPDSVGIAYVRLYNISEGKPVPYSDLTTSSTSPLLLTSQPIKLEGLSVFKVQMKSSQKHTAVLTQARIKITL